MFKDRASTTRVNVSVTGGNQSVRYYVGGSFYTEGSILNVQKSDTYDANMRYSKYNFRANVDINITKSTELSLSLANLYSTKKPSRHYASGSLRQHNAYYSCRYSDCIL